MRTLRAVMTVGIVGTIVITATARTRGRGPDAPAQEPARVAFESSIVKEISRCCRQRVERPTPD
jgi:hypothetical protein